MSFYGRMQATADRLLRQFGEPREMVLERPADDGIGDPWDPYAVDPAVHDVVGVVPTLNRSNIERLANTVGQGLVDANTRLVVIAAKGLEIEPAHGDTLVMDGERWQVLGVTPSSPGGIPLVYFLGVRR